MTQKVGWENITLRIHFWSTFPCYKQQKQNKPFLVYCFCLTKIWSTAPLQSFTHTIARLAFGKNSFLCSYLAISFQLKCLAIFKSLLTPQKNYFPTSTQVTEMAIFAGISGKPDFQYKPIQSQPFHLQMRANI